MENTDHISESPDLTKRETLNNQNRISNTQTDNNIYPQTFVIAVVLSLASIALLLLGFIFFLQLSHPKTNPQTQSVAKESAVQQPNSNLDCEYVLNQDNFVPSTAPVAKISAMNETKIRLSLHDKAFLQTMLNTTEDINQMIYDEPSNTVFYMMGKQIPTPTSSRSIHIYNLDTQKDLSVFSYQTIMTKSSTGSNNFDYIHSFALSPDTKSLYFFSGHAIWRYTLATKKLDQIFLDSNFLIYHYFFVNQDNNKLIFVFQNAKYFGSQVFDIATGQFTPIPDSEWPENDEPGGKIPIALTQTESSFFKYWNTSEYCSADTNWQEKQCTVLPTSSVFSPVLFLSDDSFLVSGLKTDKDKTISCTFREKTREVTPRYNLLLKINTKTQHVIELLRMNSTQLSVYPPHLIMNVATVHINGEVKIFAFIKDHDLERILMSNSDQLNDVSVVEFE